jgi:hypothetical protein
VPACLPAVGEVRRVWMGEKGKSLPTWTSCCGDETRRTTGCEEPVDWTGTANGTISR